MTGALAIFAKTPGLSPVKTRLAAEIGTKKAKEFYMYSVKCAEELALEVAHESSDNLIPYWAIGEQNGVNDPLWANLNRLWTGTGDLGQRLDHVYSVLLQQHDHVILIGTDSPQLQPSTILDAHKYLSTKNGSIIGPADDGGYYLFGGHVSLPHELWTSVPYSVSNTCAVFSQRLASHGGIKMLTPDFDVDDNDDFLRLRTCTTIMTSKAQQKLLKWLEGELP